MNGETRPPSCSLPTTPNHLQDPTRSATVFSTTTPPPRMHSAIITSYLLNQPTQPPSVLTILTRTKWSTPKPITTSTPSMTHEHTPAHPPPSRLHIISRCCPWIPSPVAAADTEDRDSCWSRRARRSVGPWISRRESALIWVAGPTSRRKTTSWTGSTAGRDRWSRGWPTRRDVRLRVAVPISRTPSTTTDATRSVSSTPRPPRLLPLVWLSDSANSVAGSLNYQTIPPHAVHISHIFCSLTPTYLGQVPLSHSSIIASFFSTKK